MTHLLETNFKRLCTLYKQHESTVEDLHRALVVEHVPDIQKEFDLDFIQVERVRQYCGDKATLFRFLRKSSFDFDSALNSLIANIRWRIENNIDSFMLADIHPYYLRNGLFFFHDKTDKFGRPYADEDLPPTAEETKRYFIFCAEVARKLMWDMTKQAKEFPVLQYSVLLDLKGAGVSNLNIELGQFMMDIARHHYPSSIAVTYVLNYGWMYSGVWQIAKRVLPGESLGRIIFLSKYQELYQYIDKENVLIEHGGDDEYVYDLDTCHVFQKYARPQPILKMPAPFSRAPSVESLHEMFYSAPSTPYQSRPGTPRFNSRTTPFSSRPPSPVTIPSWLKMTPSSTTNPGRSFSTLTSVSNNIDNNISKSTSTPTILSPQPIKLLSSPHIHLTSPILSALNFTSIIEDNTSSSSASDDQSSQDSSPNEIDDQNIDNLFEDNLHQVSKHDDISHKETNNTNNTKDDRKLVHGSSSSLLFSYHNLLRLRQTFKYYFTKMFRKFLKRRASKAVYWLIIMVVLRGGLVNEIWKVVMQQTIMQLEWQASTTTMLTTAALSTALSGRSSVAGNRLLIG
ncbi:2735_t:CDS:2 [Ambispora gerdemannii]|uniref:2735_t:CDS:1 n=1 Tax=Ambispora gerdemannii TaxID=144530 RepID=A0A9N9B0D3_9GLOM|nr:2735_t:CDS:2 [Ambispora gerdemannii]